MKKSTKKTETEKREQTRIRVARHRENKRNSTTLSDFTPSEIIPQSIQRELLSPVTAVTKGVNRRIDAHFNNYEFGLRGLAMTTAGGALGYGFVRTHATRPTIQDYLLGIGVGATAGLALDVFLLAPALNALEQSEQVQPTADIVYLSDMHTATGVSIDSDLSKLVGSSTIPLQSSLVVYGTAGHGKSHFATKLASMFSRMGTTLYLSSEEGVYKPLKDRFARYGAHEVGFAPVSTKQDVIALVEAQRPQFVVLDSLTNLGLSESETVEFARWLKSQVIASVVVLHATKNQSYRGQTTLIHNATIEFSVSEGVVTVGKNRVGASGGTLNLFEPSGNVIQMPRHAGQAM